MIRARKMRTQINRGKRPSFKDPPDGGDDDPDDDPDDEDWDYWGAWWEEGEEEEPYSGTENCTEPRDEDEADLEREVKALWAIYEFNESQKEKQNEAKESARKDEIRADIAKLKEKLEGAEEDKEIQVCS